MASKSKPLLKQTAFAALISIALGILNANAAHESDFAAAIDKLCAQTGLQRVGPVKLLERTDYADLRYYVQVPLLVEGTKHRYKMHLDDNFRITDFEPQGRRFVSGGLIEYPPG